MTKAILPSERWGPGLPASSAPHGLGELNHAVAARDDGAGPLRLWLGPSRLDQLLPPEESGCEHVLIKRDNTAERMGGAASRYWWRGSDALLERDGDARHRICVWSRVDDDGLGVADPEPVLAG